MEEKEVHNPSHSELPQAKEEIVGLDQRFEDQYSLVEMPTKEELEDFLRGLSGKKPLYGLRPIYNIKTHRIER